MVDIDPPSAAAVSGETLDQFGQLGELLCSIEEAALILGKTEASLTNYFDRHAKARKAFMGGRGRGLQALRRSQFKLAETNATMAIFLGKTYLGQAERRESDQSAEPDVSRAAQKVRDRIAALVAAARSREGAEGPE